MVTKSWTPNLATTRLYKPHRKTRIVQKPQPEQKGVKLIVLAFVKSIWNGWDKGVHTSEKAVPV